MKVLILNSGIGKRMGKVTRNIPKCLIEINGNETILGRQLTILKRLSLTDIIITTGPFENKIKEYINKNFDGLHINYINNPEYNSTNYIYSIFLVREFINDDILLMHGDMVFRESVLVKLLNSKYKNAVLVNKIISPPLKDFKGKITDGKVEKIGVNLFDDNCYFLAPVYKISKCSFLKWLSEIEKFVERNETNAYAETAFNNISSEINLYPVYFDHELCMEVDDMKDVEVVNEMLT